MGAMLDVAVGLTFVLVLLSLLCTAVAEALEHVFKYRAYYLQLGIEKLLLAGNTALREQLYEHPLIRSLYTGSQTSGRIRSAGPSYIPSRQFALAFLDVVTNAGGGGASPKDGTELDTALTANARNLPQPVVSVLRTLLADARGDLEKVKTGVAAWFDGSMDRVAGWYKRRAQLVLLVIGLAVAVGVNADTLEIVDTLSNDSAVRASVVAAVENSVQNNARPTQVPSGGQPPRDPTLRSDRDSADPTSGGHRPSAQDLKKGPVEATDLAKDIVKQLGGLGVPIGWQRYDKTGPADRVKQRAWPGWRWSGLWQEQLKSHFFGWMITGLALSLGAPFWFDVLNKIMVIRSTVKPHEKSQEEASEDRG